MFKNYTPNEIVQIVSDCVPNFKKACESNEASGIIIHQDGFAADLQFDEILLLGLAVKYAGFYGRSVAFIGKHNETLKP